MVQACVDRHTLGAAMSVGIGAGMCRQEKGMARWQGKLRRDTRRDSGRRGVERTFGCRCLVPNQATHHRGPKTCGAIGLLCAAAGDY